MAINRAAAHGASLVHGPTYSQIVDKTFGALLHEEAETYGSSPLVVSDHQNRTLTYAEADKRSDHLARGLAAVGVRKGDRVAIIMGNMVEYVELFYVCAKLAALITFANYGYCTASKNSTPRSHRAEAAFWLWPQGLIDTITIPGFRI
jgi:long-chain acyl-CoA synthetase